MGNLTEPAVAEAAEPSSILPSLFRAICATFAGSVLLCAIISGVVEGSPILVAVAILLLIVGGGYLGLVAIGIPVLCFGMTCDLGRNIMTALPARDEPFFDEQDKCFCQCEHSIAWGDDIMCEIKKKTLSELTAEEIRSCKAFLPCDDEEKKI